MALHSFSRLVFGCVTGFSVLCFGLSGNVSASETNSTRHLTPEQSLDIFGSSLDCTYYDGSAYVDSVFTYDSVATLSSGSALWAKTAFGFVGGTASGDGEQILVYTADFSANANPQYITVRINPEYSFFNTSYVHCIAGLSSYSALASSAYSAPSWLWYKSDVGDIYSSYTDGSLSDMRGVKFWLDGRDWFDCTACSVEFDQSNTFSAYSKHISFYGNSPYTSGSVPMKYYFFISCPVISGDADAVSGTAVTSGSGSGGNTDINVNVDVDLEETNGLLGGIIDAIQGIAGAIWDGITAVFVPSEDAVEDFKGHIDETLQETFAPLYTAGVLTEQAFDLFTGAVPDGDITLPAAQFTVNGVDVTLWPAQDVPIRPAYTRFKVLYDTLELIIDFVCTIAVLNMLRNKIEGILVGEVAVVHVD